MASPTFVAASAWANVPSAGNGNATVNKPTGVAEGHFLLLVVITGNSSSASSTTPPSGFTQETGARQANTVYRSGCQWWWKIAGASEPSTYTVTETNAGSPGEAVMLAWSGVDGAAPIDVFVADTTDQGGATAIELAEVTTTGADRTYIGIVWEYSNRTISISAAGSNTLRTSIASGGRTVAVLDEAIASAGAVTGRTATAASAGDWRGFALAIKPSGGGGSALGAISYYRRQL